MKKRVFSLVLALLMLMNIVALMPTANAATFSDVPDNHWAKSYIEEMQGSNIINGYGDGTFKPEKEVKTGEFIKMAVMCWYPINVTGKQKSGEHWSAPYARFADSTLIYYPDYNYEKLESFITREEAVEIIWKLYRVHNEGKAIEIDKTEKYIKQYVDESTIIGEDSRGYFNACIQYELINGFEDMTLKPKNTLTRAQAAKLLSIAIAE